MDALVATDGGLVRVGDGGVGVVVPGDASAVSDGWAVVDGSLWAGPDWHRVAGVEGPEATCVAESDEGVLVGTLEAHLLRLEGGALVPVATFEEAPEREAWYTPWGGPPDTRTLAVAPDGAAYVNVHVGGVLRSDDAVGSGGWKPTLDIDVDVHQIVAAPSGRLLVATGAAAFAWSDDRGASWSWLSDGFHGTYHRAVAVAGDTVLVTASTGPRTDRGAVYRVDPDTGSVERCRDGLPEWFAGNVDSQWVAADGDTVVLASPEGDLYRSEDAGRRWARMATGLGAIRSVALAG